METLQIKDWLANANSKQFEIIQESELDIYKVRRIEDGHFLALGEAVRYTDEFGHTFSASITAFFEDCIHLRLARTIIAEINNVVKIATRSEHSFIWSGNLDPVDEK